MLEFVVVLFIFLLLADFQLKRKVKLISAPPSSSIPKTVSPDQMKPIYPVRCNVIRSAGGQLLFQRLSSFLFVYMAIMFLHIIKVAAIKWRLPL